MAQQANVETEIKIAMESASEAAAKLAAAGLVPTGPRAFESNIVWDFDDSRLRASNQLLRLRDYRGQAVLTYKGPPKPSRHKTREELELTLADPGTLSLILQKLGLEPRYRYEKYRTEFASPGAPGVATLDETPIGVFVELEGRAEWIDATAQAMGTRPEDYILHSYSRLWEDYAARLGLAAGNGMVFDATLCQGVSLNRDSDRT
ncbi:MAG: class IV adenylate cyclase [Bryobacteraceae bacterium]